MSARPSIRSQLTSALEDLSPFKVTILMVFKFHMWHDQTTGLQEEKNQPGRESKMAASA